MCLGTESWLGESIQDSEAFLPVFSVHRQDKLSHGGGVFLLVSQDLRSAHLDFVRDSLESVWACIFVEGLTFALRECHRLPAFGCH